MKKTQLIGLAMMLPLPIMLVFLVLNAKMWVIAIMLALFSLMFSFGLKLLKGQNLKDVGNSAIKRVDKLSEDVQDKGKSL